MVYVLGVLSGSEVPEEGSILLGRLFQKGKEFRLTCMNMMVVHTSALVFGIGPTPYTVFSIFTVGKAVDVIHTINTKIAVSIVTEK